MGQDTAVSFEFWKFLLRRKCNPQKTVSIDLGNTFKPSGVWAGRGGQVGGLEMEQGRKVRIDFRKSLHSPQGNPFFQPPRIEPDTPGLLVPGSQFLWEWTLTNGLLDPGEMFISEVQLVSQVTPNNLQSNTLIGLMVALQRN